MSKDWCADIAEMHNKFGVNEKIREFDKDKLEKFLEFRIKFLEEELNELKNAEGAEDVVDALIDLCVVAIGTLNAFDVDPYKSWDSVHTANMAKQVGVKASRPNPLNMPDLIKPTIETHGYNWVAPSHIGNHGLLSKLEYPLKNKNNS